MAVDVPQEAPAAAQPLADGAEPLAGAGQPKVEPAAAASPEQPAAASPAAAATEGEAAARSAAACAVKTEPPSVAGSRGTSPPAGATPQAATPADPAAVAAAAAAAASSGGAPNSGGKGGRAGNKSDFQKEALEAAFASELCWHCFAGWRVAALCVDGKCLLPVCRRCSGWPRMPPWAPKLCSSPPPPLAMLFPCSEPLPH